jgi:uncharacterized protein YraI
MTMQIKSMMSIAAITAAMTLPGAVSAATLASATTDLNVRSGPGPQYPVIGYIRSNQQATIEGCIQGSLWCRVDISGRQGWAYSKYMTARIGGRTVAIAQQPAAVGVPTITYEAAANPVAVGAANGVATGEVIAGPVGAVVGGTVGAIGGAIAPPPGEVATYVTSHPVQPVYLNGEVVVGAGVPQTVSLYPVPDYQYEYAYVNSVPVLVEPSSRRIMYIYR